MQDTSSPSILLQSGKPQMESFSPLLATTVLERCGLTEDGPENNKDEPKSRKHDLRRKSERNEVAQSRKENTGGDMIKIFKSVKSQKENNISPCPQDMGKEVRI